MEQAEGAQGRAAPTHAELERAIVSVPGVAEAHVTLVEETGKSRLRIRLTNDDDAEAVSWAIAATLRERFGISLDPEQIRPRSLASAIGDDLAAQAAAAKGSGGKPEALGGPAAPVAPAGEVEGEGQPRAAGPAPDETAAEGAAGPTDADAGAPGDSPAAEPGTAEAGEERPGDELTISGDRRRLGEAARALLEQGDKPGEDPETADAPPLHDHPVPQGDEGAAERPPTGAPSAISHLPVTRHGDDGARARIRHLDTRVDISDVSVTATLGFGSREATGSARSVPTEQGVLRAVAEATLRALAELTGDRLVAGIDAVAASVTGEPPIATVVVSIVTDRGDESLLGSSLVRRDPQRAVMRATLDALNRRVEPWLEVEIAG